MTIFDFHCWRNADGRTSYMLIPIEAFCLQQTMVPPRFNPFCAAVRKHAHSAAAHEVAGRLRTGACEFLRSQENISESSSSPHAPICEECSVVPFLDSTDEALLNSVPWRKCWLYYHICRDISPCYKSDLQHFAKLLTDIRRHGIDAAISQWQKHPECYTAHCWAGLLELGVPIVIHSHLVAFAMGGQLVFVRRAAREANERSAFNSFRQKVLAAVLQVPCLRAETALREVRQSLEYERWKAAEQEQKCLWFVRNADLEDKVATLRRNAILIQNDGSERYSKRRRIQEECFQDELCARLEIGIARHPENPLLALPEILQRMREFWAFRDVVYLAQSAGTDKNYAFLVDSELCLSLKDGDLTVPKISFTSGQVPVLGSMIANQREPLAERRPGCKWVPTISSLEALRHWGEATDVLAYVMPTNFGQDLFIFHYRDDDRISFKPHVFEPSIECAESIRRICSSLSKRLSVAAEKQHLEEHLQETREQLETHAGDILASARDIASGGMARMMNHDIRSALNDLQALLEDLASRPRVKDERKILADIRKVEHDISDITQRLEELLKHFRSAGGDQPTELHGVDTLVNRAISLCSGRCRRENVTMRREYAEPLPCVQCKDVEIVEVVYNLLTNAIKSLQKSVRKEITVSIQVIEGTKVQIVVSDTGCGMSALDRGHLFDPFFSRTGSSGLGLFSCKEVVRRLGGTINCQNTAVGRGSIFVVTLEAVWKKPK